MKIAIFVTLVVFLLTWAQAKQNSKPDGDRKPADSHGEVMLSNAQFEAAAKYALNEGADSMRVVSVKKRIDCVSERGAFFEVRYGSMNSKSGVESAEAKSTLLRVSYQGREQMDAPVAENLPVEVYDKGIECKLLKESA